MLNKLDQLITLKEKIINDGVNSDDALMYNIITNEKINPLAYTTHHSSVGLTDMVTSIERYMYNLENMNYANVLDVYAGYYKTLQRLHIDYNDNINIHVLNEYINTNPIGVYVKHKVDNPFDWNISKWCNELDIDNTLNILYTTTDVGPKLSANVVLRSIKKDYIGGNNRLSLFRYYLKGKDVSNMKMRDLLTASHDIIDDINNRKLKYLDDKKNYTFYGKFKYLPNDNINYDVTKDLLNYTNILETDTVSVSVIKLSNILTQIGNDKK